MRRPLLFLCVCLFVLTALGMQIMNPPPWDGAMAISAGEEVFLVGQVYKKEYKKTFGEETILFYLDVIDYSNEAEASNHEIYQKFNSETSQYLTKIICEMNMNEMPGQVEGGVFLPCLGERVLLQGQWQEFAHATNQGEYDYANYYAIEGIEGKVKCTKLIMSDQRQWFVREQLFQIRQLFLRNLYDAFEQKEAAILAKMLLGDGSGLDKEVRELYQDNGIIHILSISGLHISMIGMGIYKLLRRGSCPIRVAAVLGGIFIVLYGMMTGFGVSACRAIGMYLIHMLGEIWGKTYDMLTAMGVLGILLVMENPRLVYHSGYLLSFASVCGVGLLAPLLQAATGQQESDVGERHVGLQMSSAGHNRMGMLRGRGGLLVVRPYDTAGVKWLKKRGAKVWNSLMVSLSVTLFTLPIQLFFFYKIPVYSVFINLLVIPFVSIVMVIGFAVMLFPGLGFLCPVESLIFAWFEWLCQMFQKQPAHTWLTGRPQMWKVLVYYIVLMLVVCLGKRCRKSTIMGVLAGLVLFVGIRFHSGTSITFLDVGQGDCICVQTASGKCYLFDGGSSNRSNVGEKIIIPYLQYCGVSKVDAVLVSHPDEDHMNGLEALFQCEEIQVERLILPKVQGAQEEFGALLEMAEGGPDKENSGASVGSSSWSEKDLYEDAGNSSWSEKDLYEDAENSGWSKKDLYEVTRNSEGMFGKSKEAILVEYVSKGAVLEGEGYRMICLHPAQNYSADSNAYSACYLLEAEGVSVLFTGDVEAMGEEDLVSELKRSGVCQVDVLKVAHHGSRYSTSEQFLNTLDATLAVISCGRNNLYGHPHEETLERLAKDGSVVWSTAERGQITVEIGSGEEIRVWSVVCPTGGAESDKQ